MPLALSTDVHHDSDRDLRSSPPTPPISLPPLRSLQRYSTKRGSITDPVLHASNSPSHLPLSAVRSHRLPGLRSMSQSPGPAATDSLDEPGPSHHHQRFSLASGSHSRQATDRLTSPILSRSRPHQDQDPADDDDPYDFGGFTMRRHARPFSPNNLLPSASPLPSISSTNSSSFLPPPLPPFSGQKRKMSHDRAAMSLPPFSSSDDSSPTLPTQHTFIPPMALDQDHEGGPPPSKRRGSAFDARISQLSLYDSRRDSVHSVHSGHSLDSRASVPLSTSTTWASRRDSSASQYSNTSLSSPGGPPNTFHSTESGQHSSNHWQSPSHVQIKREPQSYHQTLGHRDAHHDDYSQPYQPLPSPPIHHHRSSVPTIPSLAFPSSSQQQARHQREDSMSTQAQSQRRMSVSDVVISKNGRGYLKSRSSESGSLSNERSNGSSSESTARHGRRGNSQDVGSNEIYSSSLAPPGARNGDVIQISERDHRSGETPYSRSPELRVSHKLAERKRRKEMKELFDELREHLPADRRMKASKWEILTKAVEYITQLKQAYDDCQAELDELKRESNVDSARHSDREEDLARHSIPRSEHIIYTSYRHPSSSGQRTEPIAHQASSYDDSSRSSATPSPLGQIHSPSRQTRSD